MAFSSPSSQRSHHSAPVNAAGDDADEAAALLPVYAPSPGAPSAGPRAQSTAAAMTSSTAHLSPSPSTCSCVVVSTVVVSVMVEVLLLGPLGFTAYAAGQGGTPRSIRALMVLMCIVAGLLCVATPVLARYIVLVDTLYRQAEAGVRVSRTTLVALSKRLLVTLAVTLGTHAVWTVVFTLMVVVSYTSCHEESCLPIGLYYAIIGAMTLLSSVISAAFFWPLTVRRSVGTFENRFGATMLLDDDDDDDDDDGSSMIDAGSVGMLKA